MKKILVITFSIIMITLNLFAQTVSTSTNNGKSSIDKMGIDWNIFANHPMRELMDSATLLSTDLYSILNATNTSGYIDNSVRYLVRFNPLLKYMTPYRNAKDEFERQEVEKQILNDYQVIIDHYQDVLDPYSKNSNYFWTGTIMKLAEYSFSDKGFRFQSNQMDIFKTNLEKMKIEDNIGGEPFPNLLSMDETTAKQFIRDNPSREVMVYAFLDNFKCYPDPSAHSQIKFITFTSLPKNNREKVIAVYPNAKYFNKYLEQLDSIIPKTSKTTYALDLKEPLTIGEFELICETGANYERHHFMNFYNKYKNYGFQSGISVSVQKAIERNMQYYKTQKEIYLAFLKIGKTYNGYQEYKGGIKRNILITFTKRSDDTYFGTCTYRNGKKMEVYAYINKYEELPRLIICGCGSDDYACGFTFCNGQLEGYLANEKEDCSSFSKTFISTK